MPKKKNVIFRGTLADAAHHGELDHAASVRAGKIARARQKECYLNALRASHYADAAKILYVEGYATLSSVPGLDVEHGWLLCDGKVIDPTAAAFRDAPFNHYRPVIVWDRDAMTLQALEQGTVPLSLWPARWEEGRLTVKEVARAWRIAFLEPFGDALAAAPELLRMLELS